MRRYSKLAIYKLNKIDNGKGEFFYDVTGVENIYNPSKPFNSWECTFVKCTIFTDLELEIANFDLQANPNPLSFDNISNPEHSIIRILDFSVENHTVWKKTTKNGKPYYEQVKTENGKPKTAQKFYVHSIEYDHPSWKSEESKIKYYERRNTVQNEANKKLREKISELKKEIHALTRSLENSKNRSKELRVQVKQLTPKIEIPKEQYIGDYNKLEFEDM